LLYRAPSPTATSTLSLHDALPICAARRPGPHAGVLRAVGGKEHPRRHHARERKIPFVSPHDPESFSGGRVEQGSRAEARRRTSRSEEHTSELQSLAYLVCRLLLEK